MSSEQTPRYIGSYKIIDELGGGSFGTVFRAFQPFLERQVAVKVLHDYFFERAPSERMFMNEGRTIARLRHPNIVNVYEFGVAQDSLTNQTINFMVMEYLPGSTLQKRMRADRLSIEEIVRLVEQVAQGLAYAHERNVIHRDLKPANILFSETNQPVIVDFGLAKLAEDKLAVTETTGDGQPGKSGPPSIGLTTLGMMGTPRYMAPEQMTGERITPATDQFALGLIAYEMLAGQLPFDAPTVSELAVRRAMDPSPSILTLAPDLPPAIGKVMDRALALDPAMRFESVAAFAHAFGDALLPNHHEEAPRQVIDPLYAAQLQIANRYVSGFLAGLGLVILIAILFCAAEFLRGYAVGSSPEFLWDGLIVSSSRLTDGTRQVNGMLPGSVAQAAGYQIGDKIQDDLVLDIANPEGAYLVNGVTRSALNVDWRPKPGTLIERRVLRGSATVTLTYVLQRSAYSLIILSATLVSALVGLLCGFWMLRRWGAEPGVQIYVPLTFLFSLFIVARAVANLILYLDTLTYHLSLAFLLHIIIVFPQEMAWVKRHPRRIGLLYAPVVVGLYYFLTRSPIILPIVHLPLQALDYVVYNIAIFALIYRKWLRRDMKTYPDVRWLIGGFAFAMVLSAYYVIVFYLLPVEVLNNVLGGATLQTVINDIVLVLLQSVLPILIAIGVHHIQKQIGTSASRMVVVPTPL